MHQERNRTKRMLLLFAAVSPLASLMRLVFLIYEYFFDDTAVKSAAGTFMFDVLRQNSTLSELIQDVMKKDRNDKKLQELASLLLENMRSSGNIEVLGRDGQIAKEFMKLDNIHADIQLVIPWLFALFILFVAPCFCAMMRGSNSDMYGVYPGEHIADFRSRKKVQRKIRRLISCLDSYQMELMETDFQTLEEEPHENSILEDVQTNSMPVERKIIIPRSSQMNHVSEASSATSEQSGLTSSKVTTAHAPGTCAICLSAYEQGDTIVWSSNNLCSHVFHKNCMVTWIEKRCSADCPCCRQPFIDQTVYLVKKKVKNE